MQPLADLIRPTSLEGVVGQQHLLGEGKALSQIIKSGHIPNMIFYGPSGVGKTTVANIIANNLKRKLFKLNGTNASLADIKEVIAKLDTLEGVNGVVLYLDEIQYLNKKQQQSLLEFIEDGRITLIASTTENPYFYIYGAILSRCTVFEFLPIGSDEMMRAVENAYNEAKRLKEVEFSVSCEVLEYISSACGGDVRKAINAVELSVLMLMSGNICSIDIENIKTITQKSSMRYDRDGDQHYDILSALQKSIRGSDPNAAVHYLARLVEAGDLISPCRRLLVIACEDVGLAYPSAVGVVKACVDCATQLGYPEARIPLAQACLYLATLPKSNSAMTAIDNAVIALRTNANLDIPAHLKDAHYNGAKAMGRGETYRYPHDYAFNYTRQQYLPDCLEGSSYYIYGDNKVEQTAKKYWDNVVKMTENGG